MDDIVYFAAGIWPSEGIYLYALDASTGKVIWVNDKGKTHIDYRPVKLQPMTNDVQSFPPKARVY